MTTPVGRYEVLMFTVRSVAIAFLALGYGGLGLTVAAQSPEPRACGARRRGVRTVEQPCRPWVCGGRHPHWQPRLRTRLR